MTAIGTAALDRNYTNVIANDVACDITGQKISYTPPNGYVGIIRYYSILIIAVASGTWLVNILRGGTTIRVNSGAIANFFVPHIVVLPADIFEINISGAGAAGSICDFYIAAEEVPV